MRSCHSIINGQPIHVMLPALLTLQPSIWLRPESVCFGALAGLAAVTALVLLRDDGRGQRVNRVELQAGQRA
jgi:hypothetical protein